MSNKALVTGGAGFIGSHVAEKLALLGYDVIVIDNLSRAEILGKSDICFDYNWNYLKKYPNIKLVKSDVRNFELIKELTKDVSVIFHAAAQTAVTVSIENPYLDFSSNLIGSLNILEAARINKKNPAIIYCSTNKVYGDNVNFVPIIENEKRYSFSHQYLKGISEKFSIDHTKHTPYGCSKICSDIYMQDYARLYGLKIGIFRMSCIYGTRQFGLEDQGWVAWFTIATLLNKTINIYGDGKQVRDILFIDDLIDLYFNFLNSNIPFEVYNTGGGSEFTLSLIELLDILESITGKRSTVSYHDWRPSDQKVYVSDISKAFQSLNWKPRISPEDGIKKLASWVKDNMEIFK